MEISVGTYEGALVFLQSDLTQIKAIKSLQISTNSIKSLCLKDNFLIAGGHDQEVRVIDMESFQEKVEAKENVGMITKIVPVNDRLFLVGVDDGTIRLWNSQNWTIVNQARFHKKSVSSIVVCKEGKLMISAGGNKIIVWSAQNLKKAHEYKFEKDILIQNLKISEDMKFTYFSNSKAELHRITTENNEQKLMVKMPLARKIQDFVLCGDFIVVANDIGEVSAWRSDSQIQFEKRIWFKAHEARIKELKIVAELYLLVVTAAGDVSLWDFPQFLKSVDNVSQSYHLDGLQPLCSTQIKGRILCADAVIYGQIKQVKKASQKAQKVIKEVHEDVNEEEIKVKKEKKKKTKLIEKEKVLNKAKKGKGDRKK